MELFQQLNQAELSISWASIPEGEGEKGTLRLRAVLVSEDKHVFDDMELKDRFGIDEVHVLFNPENSLIYVRVFNEGRTESAVWFPAFPYWCNG